jgi:hypothetical protein
MAKMLNLEKVLARLRKLPDAMKDAASGELDKQVDGLVQAIRRAAPNSPETDGAKLRDSVHAYKNPDRPLSYRIIADAKGEDGSFIGSPVEHGHRAKDGTHVPADPFFYPTYRAHRKRIRARTLAASRKALKQLYPE